MTIQRPAAQGATLDLRSGLSSTQRRTADVNRSAAASSARIVVLVGSEKFDRTALVSPVALSAADRVITDAGLPDSVAARYREAGVDLVIGGER